MAKVHKERILILAKTYPSPSKKYIETSCVAGINAQGEMRRLYPVKFRLIEDGKQFKKWQWIDVNIEKANADHRRESHKLDVGTLRVFNVIETKKNWYQRYEWIDKIPTYENIESLEEGRLTEQNTLSLIKPKKLLGLDIVAVDSPEWTEEEKLKLAQSQMQGDLFFDVSEAKTEVQELRKVPYSFYYRYICDSSEGEIEYRHKIIDWEAGATFWKFKKQYGRNWEEHFRKNFETDMKNKNLMFLMGNQHRFPNQWLIISIIYPPKRKLAEDENQMLLF